MLKPSLKASIYTSQKIDIRVSYPQRANKKHWTSSLRLRRCESPRLHCYVFRRFSQSNLEEVGALLDGIKEELSKIEEDLGKAVAKVLHVR